MDSAHPGGRGTRGHRPYRGSGGGGRGHGRGGRGGGGRGGHHGGSRGGGGGHNRDVPYEPSRDPTLAPRPPHPGYFHASFVENPWYDLETKLGIPHLKPIVDTPKPQVPQADSIEATAQQPSEEAGS